MPQIRSLLNVRGKFLLLLIDLTLLIVAFTWAGFFRFGYWSFAWWTEPTSAVVALVTLIFFYVFGAYDLEEEGGRAFVWIRTGLPLLMTLGAVLTLNYLFQVDRAGFYGRGVLLGGLGMAWILTGLLRLSVRSRLNQIHRDQSWLLLTSAEEAAFFAEELRRNRLQGLLQVQVLGAPGASNVEEFRRLLQTPRSGVILAASEDLWGRFGAELVEARLHGLLIVPLSAVFERLWKKIPVQHLDHRWFLQNDGFVLVNSPVRQKIKRLMDLILGLGLLAVLWPFMILTALAVRLESRGAAIYSQIRTGKGGSPFVIFKFRSMRNDAEKAGAQWAQAQDPRITKVGNFIRKTRLDEFPQLFNVLRGDMSFVGPRPERPEFNESLAKEIPYYQLRHLVRPGITGWAQIMYPYGASAEDALRKLEFDLYYIKNYSLWLDVKILLKTVRTVIFAKGR